MLSSKPHLPQVFIKIYKRVALKLKILKECRRKQIKILLSVPRPRNSTTLGHHRRVWPFLKRQESTLTKQFRWKRRGIKYLYCVAPPNTGSSQAYLLSQASEC